MHIQPHHSPFDPDRFSQRQPAASSADRIATTQAIALQASTDFSGTVKVMTAEGDKVTLNLDVEADFRYANLNYREQRAGQSLTVNAESAESSLTQSLGLTAEGDLNDQELADLTKLFKSITNIFRKYLSGHDEQAGAKTSKLTERFEKFSSLADLDLNVEVTRSLTVAAAGQATTPGALPSESSDESATPSTSPSETPVTTPSAEATIPPVSTEDAAPTESIPSVDAGGSETSPASLEPAPVAASNPDSAAPSIAALESKPAPSPEDLANRIIQDSVFASPKLKSFLPGLIKQAMSELKHDPELPGTKSAMDKLHGEILQALQERKANHVAAAAVVAYAPKAPTTPELSQVA